MEGNFRIVQLADFEFVIEKENIYTIKHPWYKFKKPTEYRKWVIVSEDGHFASAFSPKEHFKCSTLAEAKDQLNKIRKYPIYYTE